MTRSHDILFTTEYIKNVLYFAAVKQGKVLKSTSEIHYFSIDSDLVYENYYSDFGPLNLGCVYKYCKILNDKLKQYLNKQTIVHYTSTEPNKKANAAFLLGCYGVLYLSLPPRDALKPLVMHGQTYRSFQDATPGDSMYTISLLDCLQGIKKARDLGFFNFQDFDYEEYERYDKIQGGDLNWIVPGTFLAFIGPVDYSVNLYHPPEMYLDYFWSNNVKIVIRLNKRMYDGNVFNSAGIVHYDLFFPDGTCPPRHILAKFLQISEESDSAIAVHCKAGLGRTGSLIGCYLIKHYRMSAHEAIAWMRICRPGSVIGHQQGWLEQMEPWLIKQGNLYRKRNYQDTERLPVHEFGVYSIAEKSYTRYSTVPSRSQSPPPPINRQIRPEISTPRPQASKVREAPSKISEKDPNDWRVRSPKLSSSQKTQSKSRRDLSDSGLTSLNRQSNGSGSGGGEPRPPSRQQSRSSNKPVLQQDKEKDYYTKLYGYYTPVPTFRTSQGPLIKTLNDARNFLIKSSLCNEHRDKKLNNAITVTPQHTYRMNERYNSPVRATGSLVPPPPFSSVNKDPIQPQLQHRRRLGRSPSPSPSNSPTRFSETSRATNTVSPAPPANKYNLRDTSRSALREALSRLKLTLPRDGSAGAASVGAASLGARIEAPAAKRAPSVRSDERPLATQGDMLNSIKFQRRYRDTFKANNLTTTHNEKMNQQAREKSGLKESPRNHSSTTANRLGPHHDYHPIPWERMSAREDSKQNNTGCRLGFSAEHRNKSNVKDVNSTLTTGYRLGFTQDIGGSARDKNVHSASRAAFNTSRQSSPKPRARNTPSSFY